MQKHRVKSKLKLPKNKRAIVLKSFAKLGFKKKFKSIYQTSYILLDLNK